MILKIENKFKIINDYKFKFYLLILIIKIIKKNNLFYYYIFINHIFTVVSEIVLGILPLLLYCG